MHKTSLRAITVALLLTATAAPATESTSHWYLPWTWFRSSQPTPAGTPARDNTPESAAHRAEKAARDAAKRPAKLVPYIGPRQFPTASGATIDDTWDVPVIEGLPKNAYQIAGDIYVPDRQAEQQAVGDAARLARQSGIDALVVATDSEVYSQTITGVGRRDPNKTYFRAWAIRYAERPKTLPDQDSKQRPEELVLSIKDRHGATTTRPYQTTGANKSERVAALREELVANAKKIEWAKQGIIPVGFDKASYVQMLEGIETQIMTDLDALNP